MKHQQILVLLSVLVGAAAAVQIDRAATTSDPLAWSLREAATALANQELLAQLGVEVSAFGGDTVLVTSYPAMLANFRPAEVLHDLVAKLQDGGKAPDRRDMLAAVVGEEKLLRCEQQARCELDLGVGLGTGYLLAGVSPCGQRPITALHLLPVDPNCKHDVPATSFPGSAWERAAGQALPGGLGAKGRRSLPGSAFPGGARE